MITLESALSDRNFYVIFTKDCIHAEFVHLSKSELPFWSILTLCRNYENGFILFGWSDSTDYRFITIRNGFVVDDESLNTRDCLKSHRSEPVKGHDAKAMP